MKIAIHNRPGSFSERWVEYCKKNNIDYKVVCAYDSDIVSKVSDCDAFMWHHHHNNFADTLIARQILYSLECAGIRVFPNWRTCWHFDDKVGQKYLLEAVGAPIVPSYVFIDKKEALRWVTQTTFPKVFKLRGGAGSQNVMLAHSEKDAQKYIRKAFGRGFSHASFKNIMNDVWRQYIKGKVSLLSVVKVFGSHIIRKIHANPTFNLEHGYAYFQDFIPNNDFDIRICIVNGKAFGLKRLVRKGDFRASGSGNIVYDRNQIDEKCVKLAFDINRQINAQSIAFDFVFNANQQPLVVEISYGYATKAYDKCEGYWDENLTWHAGQNFDFCGWMIEGLMKPQ